MYEGRCNVRNSPILFPKLITSAREILYEVLSLAIEMEPLVQMIRYHSVHEKMPLIESIEKLLSPKSIFPTDFRLSCTQPTLYIHEGHSGCLYETPQLRDISHPHLVETRIAFSDGGKSMEMMLKIFPLRYCRYCLPNGLHLSSLDEQRRPQAEEQLSLGRDPESIRLILESSTIIEPYIEFSLEYTFFTIRLRDNKIVCIIGFVDKDLGYELPLNPEAYSAWSKNGDIEYFFFLFCLELIRKLKDCDFKKLYPL